MAPKKDKAPSSSSKPAQSIRYKQKKKKPRKPLQPKDDPLQPKEDPSMSKVSCCRRPMFYFDENYCLKAYNESDLTTILQYRNTSGNPVKMAKPAINSLYSSYYGDEHEIRAKIVERCLRERKWRAKNFRSFYTYGPELERKNFIWCDRRLSSFELSSGITWVAVHGTNHICVVSMTMKPDMARLCGAYLIGLRPKSLVVSMFLESVIVETGEMSLKISGKFDPSSEMGPMAQKNYGMFNQSSKTGTSDVGGQSSEMVPFAVVSVDLGTNEASGHKAPTAAMDEEKSIRFLEEKLRNSSYISEVETVQTAIQALQYLMCQKFKSNEIKGCLLGKSEGVNGNILKEELEVHLAAINSTTG